MKTITEFPGTTLKTHVKAKQDLLTAGKTAEELPQALGEALKLEGDKLNWVLNAVELVESRSLDDLKRVVVFSLNEGEKAPKDAVQKGEHYFIAEYYPPLNPPKGKGHPPRGEGKGRGDKRGGRGKRGDRDKNKGRGPRREKKE